MRTPVVDHPAHPCWTFKTVLDYGAWFDIVGDSGGAESSLGLTGKHPQNVFCSIVTSQTCTSKISSPGYMPSQLIRLILLNVVSLNISPHCSGLVQTLL
jgi:hypothetical protein